MGGYFLSGGRVGGWTGGWVSVFATPDRLGCGEPELLNGTDVKKYFSYLGCHILVP